MLASAQKNFDLAVDDWPRSIRLDYSYRDDSNTEFDDTSSSNRFKDEYSLVNLRLGFYNEKHDLDVMLFWENIADEDGDVAVIRATGQPTRKVTTRPSTIGVNFIKRF